MKFSLMGILKAGGVAAAVSYFLYNFEDPGPNQIFLTRGKDAEYDEIIAASLAAKAQEDEKMARAKMLSK